MNLSHSTIVGLLDLCSYRIGLEKIVKLPRPTNGRLAAGIAFHAGIELHEEMRKDWFDTQGRKGDSEGEPLEEMLDRAGDVLDEQDVDWSEDDLSPEQAYDMVEAALAHWYSTPIPEGQPGAGGSLRDRVLDWRPLIVEGWFRLWMPPHTSLPTVGAIDNVYLDENGELVVVDQKSANRFGKWRLDGEGLHDQGAMYCLAAMRTPGFPGRRDQIPRFEYHIARTENGSKSNFQGSRVIEIPVDQVDLDYIEMRVGKAHVTQLEGQWVKNPEAWTCSPKWCPHHIEAGGSCEPFLPNEIDIEEYR